VDGACGHDILPSRFLLQRYELTGSNDQVVEDIYPHHLAGFDDLSGEDRASSVRVAARRVACLQ